MQRTSSSVVAVVRIELPSSTLSFCVKSNAFGTGILAYWEQYKQCATFSFALSVVSNSKSSNGKFHPSVSTSNSRLEWARVRNDEEDGIHSPGGPMPGILQISLSGGEV